MDLFHKCWIFYSLLTYLGNQIKMHKWITYMTKTSGAIAKQLAGTSGYFLMVILTKSINADTAQLESQIWFNNNNKRLIGCLSNWWSQIYLHYFKNIDRLCKFHWKTCSNLATYLCDSMNNIIISPTRVWCPVYLSYSPFAAMCGYF